MKKDIDVYEFEKEFKDMNRDYYSYEGYKALFEYYDEFEDFNLDVIAICCDVSEYNKEEFINAYGYLVDKGEFDEDEYLNALEEEINNHTTMIKLENGSYLVWEF